MCDEMKRQFSRAPLSRIVRYRPAHAQAFQNARIANISLGGMFITGETAEKIGASMYLQFTAEDGSIVAEGWARVVHARKDGLGLEFTKIDEKFIAYTQLVVSEELHRKRFRS